MAKKRNLKREKAERNREYARQFQKNRTRNNQRYSRNFGDEDGTNSSTAAED